MKLRNFCKTLGTIVFGGKNAILLARMYLFRGFIVAKCVEKRLLAIKMILSLRKTTINMRISVQFLGN